MRKLIVLFGVALLLTGCGDHMDRDTLRNKAFEHAGIQASDAYDIDEDFDNEGGTTYYELDFEVNGVEYEYTLNAKTGEIVRSHRAPAAVPPVKTEASAPLTTDAQQTTALQPITEDEAIRIALEHAGLNQGAVKSLSVELDHSDGVYEVDFYTKGIEYDYEIDAYTGEIRQAEKDPE